MENTIKKRKIVLLLCATHNDLGLVHALRKLGYYIIVTGNRAGLPGERFVDKYIPADYSDKELILQIARENEIDAICQCCNDFGVYTAAYVAEKMGLPGYDSYENTLLLHNKDKFKMFAKELGLSVVESYYFSDKNEALQWLHQAEFPVIVKPVDASAGNGILRIDSWKEAQKAVEYAFSKSREKRVIIEPFLIGTQHGFCTFLKDKRVVAYCSNNEYSVINPYRVEIDTYPADNYSRVASALICQIEKIAEKLDLKDGIFHLQYIVSEGKAYIIEVMRRILGNMYSIPAMWLTGLDWDYWETRAKCGLSCEDIPTGTKQEGAYAYKTVLASENGKIKHIVVPEEYQKYVREQFWLKQAGDEIENYKSEPVGFLFFEFSSQEEMRKVLVEEYVSTMVKM